MAHNHPLPREEALVIGGSMAGLLAARVLADHFDRVTVVDRDRFPTEPAFRPGVPQARQLHVFLRRGLDIACRLFPGIEDDLVAAGAISLEWPTDAILLSPRGWSRRFSPGTPFISCGRELLEWMVRRRIAAQGNVRFVGGQEVVGLLSASGRAVAGVRLRARPSASSAPSAPSAPSASSADASLGASEELRAGFVVDASGRHSKAPEWLTGLGYAPPEEERITSFLGYATRDYAIPAGARGDWKAIMLQAKPPESARAGYFFQIAPDRWRLGLMGAARDYPPTDEDGFRAFVRGLRSPLIAEVLADAAPLTQIHGYRDTENHRRFYERLHRFPERFVVTGDAVAAFNPIYGQGMTAAAQSALALDRLLRQRPHGDLADFGLRFQRAAAKANAGAWLIATGEDLRYPTTAGGRRDWRTRLSHRYLDRVFRAALDDRETHFAFLDVIQLVDPPTALFHPTVLAQALLRGGRPDRTTPPDRRRRTAPPGATAVPLAADGRGDGRQAVEGRSPALRTHTIQVAGVRSPVVEAGPPDASESVVFVHGNPGSSLDWIDLLQAAGRFGRAIALDMPGFGRADKPAEFDYTVPGYARHLGGALEQLGVRRAHLVLHDFGGQWGLSWAIAHPDAYASVTLIDTGVPLDYRWHSMARIWQTPLLGELFMATSTRLGFDLLLKHGNPHGLPKPFVDRMYDDFDQGTKHAVLRLYRATRNVAGAARPMATALRQIRRPALVVWGKHDPYLPLTLAERQREVFPDVRLVVLDGSGHWPMADDPQGVSQAVLPFLRTVMAHQAAGQPTEAADPPAQTAQTALAPT